MSIVISPQKTNTTSQNNCVNYSAGTSCRNSQQVANQDFSSNSSNCSHVVPDKNSDSSVQQNISDNAYKETPGGDLHRGNSSETAQSSNVNRERALKRKLVLSTECVEVLKAVKQINRESTFGELLEALKIYIVSKKLLDPKDQSRTHILADDGFMKLFGVTDFFVKDLSVLLSKVMKFVDTDAVANINITNCAGSSNGNCSVRRPASPMYLAIPASPDYRATSSDPESVQGYETEFVKDSTDEEYYSSDYGFPMPNFIAVQETIEYEVESDSDSKNEFLNHDDDCVSSSVEEQNFGEIIVIKKSDSDIEFFADESSKEDEVSDPEISKIDKWNCNNCNSSNKPWIRFCSKCWKTRSGWVPSKRPERRKPRKKRKSKKLNEKRGRSFPNASNFNAPSTSRENLLNFDSGNGSQETPDFDRAGTSQEGASCYGTSQETISSFGMQSASQDSLSRYDEPSTSQSTSLNFPSASQTSLFTCSSHESKKSDLTCMICCSRKPNAAILHGKYVHTNFLCYVCGTKLYLAKQRCPVCRRTIEKVLHNIDVSN